MDVCDKHEDAYIVYDVRGSYDCPICKKIAALEVAEEEAVNNCSYADEDRSELSAEVAGLKALVYDYESQIAALESKVEDLQSKIQEIHEKKE